MVYVHRKRRSTTFTCCFTSFRYTVCHVIRPPKCLLPTSLDASQDCLNNAGWRKLYNPTQKIEPKTQRPEARTKHHETKN